MAPQELAEITRQIAELEAMVAAPFPEAEPPRQLKPLTLEAIATMLFSCSGGMSPAALGLAAEWYTEHPRPLIDAGAFGNLDDLGLDHSGLALLRAGKAPFISR